MCNPMSGILTKDRAFWSMHTDHHTEIIAEFKLCESIANHSPETAISCLVKFEITPPNDDMRLPIDQWVYKLDQDIVPDWYDAKKCEKRARVALAEWHKARVITVSPNSPLKEGTFWIFNSTATLLGNSTATLRENSTATLRENSTATLRENSTATLLGNSTATLWGNSTATLCENSTATLRENSTATLWGNSTATLWGNSTATLLGNSTATLWGNSTATLCENSTATLRENSTATLCENSTANSFNKNKVKTEHMAVHIDRSKVMPVVTCGWLVNSGAK